MLETPINWLMSMKEKFTASSLLDKVRGSQQLLIEMGICLSAGFLIGFLLKRYAQYVAAFILFVALIFVFQHFSIVNIDINWNRIPELIGIEPIADSSDAASAYIAWAKENIWLVISFSVGFLFGLQIG